jgi:hypothetical protein
MQCHVTGNLCLTLFAIMIHEIELQFCVYFCILIPHVASHFFLSRFWLLWSQVGLLEVPTVYLKFCGYFFAREFVLPNDYPSEKLVLMGGPECAACLAWFYTLSVCTLPP